MKHEDRIRKACIILGSAAAICGGFMMLTRGNPADKAIGTVVVSNGVEPIAVDGYKYSYNNGGEESRVENFVTIENAPDIPEVDYNPDSEDGGISVSYSDEYTGELSYTVYDSQFNRIVDSQPGLEMPGERGEKYYVEIGVDWGEEEKSVTVKYYFAINIKE
ncbi:MAG: hypothetical protein ACI4JB_02250 [Porcipelethomonas sp.]